MFILAFAIVVIGYGQDNDRSNRKPIEFRTIIESCA